MRRNKWHVKFRKLIVITPVPKGSTIDFLPFLTAGYGFGELKGKKGIDNRNYPTSMFSFTILESSFNSPASKNFGRSSNGVSFTSGTGL